MLIPKSDFREVLRGILFKKGDMVTHGEDTEKSVD